jgi:predicted alpha-1,2-mannosidase
MGPFNRICVAGFVVALAVGCRPSGEPPTSSPTGEPTTVSPTAHTGSGTPTVAPVELSGPGELRALADPFVGSGGIGGEVVGATPAAGWPLGLTLVGPDTWSSVYGALPFYHFGGYHYDDDRIAGFSFTHSHAMGINDFGAVQVMPHPRWSPELTGTSGRLLPFDHDHESASPGLYEVELDEGAVQVTIVATEHGGHQRYQFAADAEPVVVLDLGHSLPNVDVVEAWAEADPVTGEVVGLQRLDGGYSDRFGGLLNHFSLQLDPAPVAVGGWVDPEQPEEGRTAVDGVTCGLWLQFAPGTTQVDLRGALSYVDVDGARANRLAELPDTDLDARLQEVQSAWDGYLDRVQIGGGSDDDRAIFATALYHSLLMPTRQDDVDGRYRGLDGEVHTTTHRMLSDMSLWDTFRTTHPWYLLAWPEVQLDTLRSLEAMVRDGGSLPRWPMAHGYTGGMVGTPAAQVIAGSWLKGMRDGYDVDLLFDATVATSTGPMPHAGRSGIEEYTTLGYVPADVSGGAASRTLEYAWSDHATALWGEAMGRDVAQLWAQSHSWKNTYDPATGFFRGRLTDGSFPDFVGEHRWTDDFVEGNAWHYRWYVPYDLPGMIELQHGGDVDAFLDTLATYWAEVEAEEDDLLPDDWYWHGNEPVIHYAALGSLAGYPEASVGAAAWISDNRYDLSPAGLDGNDDAGTLSAWYLWVALGVYPVAGTDTYAVLSPRFPHVVVHRPEGELHITGPGVPDRFDGLHAGGEPVTTGVITHEQLLSGLAFGW